MNEEWTETNRESIGQLVTLLTHKKNSGNARIVVFAGAAISKHAPADLPDANSMVEATIKVLLYDPVLGKSFQQAGLLSRLDQLIRSSCASSGRIIPPEMVYDSIYEYAGNKVFNALECLKSKSPNLNHRILAALLDRGFIDSIVTTNFDSLIEQSLSELSRNASPAEATRIWKIHGDIRRPSSMVTTMRGVGQTAFNEDLVDKLRKLLDGSHVIFVGYSGMDPDLMPAFKTAKMASVYWCVYRPEELQAGDENGILARDPYKSIADKKTPVWWITGDLQTELLSRIAKRVIDEHTQASISLMGNKSKLGDDQKGGSPLEQSITQWERNFFRRLSPVQKARAILQILYSIALYSSLPQKAWMYLIETAGAFEKEPALSKHRNSEFHRDLHAFRAEAYLKLAELVGQLSKDAIVGALSDPETRHNLDMFKRVALLKKPISLAAVVENLHQLPVNISGSNSDEIVHQLFVRAKDQLTPILPLPFRDGVQIQALLNASTILWTLAKGMREDKALRNFQGAENMLQKGLGIADRAKMDSGKRNLLKARCYSNLAVLSIAQGNPQAGLRYFGIAENLFKTCGDLYSYAGTCINMGLFLMDLYRATKINMYNDEAANSYQKAITILASFPNDGLAEAAARLGRELSREM